ncbi:MAG: hypothetical protein PWP76_79 [Candidatus Diapherotrites archaeon]|nr:hypothetical protein [Candidatus Diapherotrites archaeon]MDN5367233.1 hypothetical protein [Candidatus Diapherotrites archaeon]
MLFLFHLAIALGLGYVLIRAVIESGKKDLIIPVAGIVTLFIIHCITFRASCLSCDLNSPNCIAELLLFWLFAIWAVIRLRTNKHDI